MMNISLIIVIIFAILGYHIVCKPLAFLLHKTKKIIIDSLFNGFNIFEAYYAGLEPGRIIRVTLKIVYFLITLLIAKLFMEAYLAFINDLIILLYRNREYFFSEGCNTAITY